MLRFSRFPRLLYKIRSQSNANDFILKLLYVARLLGQGEEGAWLGDASKLSLLRAVLSSALWILKTSSQRPWYNVVVFDAKGVSQKEIVHPGEIANAVDFVEVLEKLREIVLRVQKEIAATRLLHHQYAHSDTAFSFSEFLTNHYFNWNAVTDP